MTGDDREAAPSRVHPMVVLVSSYAWRLLVIIGALSVVLWLVGQLQVVMISLVVAVFLARILSAPTEWLRRRGWRPAVASAAVLVGFLVAAVAIVGLIGLSVADQADDLGPTVSDAVDDLETWLVDDSPFDIQRGDVAQFRDDAGDAVGDALSSSSDALLAGAVAAVEVALAVLLGLVVTFFALKDGDRFLAWVQGLVPPHERPLVARLGARAWRTLGGYLRGAALLGAVEGGIMAVTLTLVGAELAAPVAALTFLGAFVPFVGAIASGVLAVLVALATTGIAEAVVVVVVALVVQQLDNDLLAPVVYGRALSLHPVAVLLGIAAGGALFGLAGSVLAVPVTAVVVNVASEARAGRAETTGASSDASPTA